MRVLLCLAPFSLILCACSSTTVEQLAQQSQTQWVCDTDPATGQWDCRRVAIGEVPPLPAAVVALEQPPQQFLPGPVQRTPVEPIVVEQQSQTVPKPEQVPAEPVAEVAEPDVASVPAKAQPKGYVVQLAALSNQAAVNRFIDEQQLSRQALAWHRTYSQGRHWYVVTTEPVGSHVEALATAGRLEGAHPGLATWVRSLQSLQQAMEDTSGR